MNAHRPHVPALFTAGIQSVLAVETLAYCRVGS